ncbi:response regulator transcription factor [bacterium]|nr:response regulator transcription factor [bacterium]
MCLVGEASDGHAALALIKETLPNIAVIDLSMPGLKGAELGKRVTELYPDVKILVLTVHEDHAYVRQLISVGARGYLLKRSAAGELVKAIHIINNGDIYIDPVIGCAFVKTMNYDSTHISSSELSPREEGVLKLLAQGFSNKEVASKLDLSIKSIETYKARAGGKLGLRTRADIVRFGVTLGWLDRI